MKKEVFIALALFIGLFGMLFLVYSFTNQSGTSNQIEAKFNKQALIYFYGETCPNCQVVNDWLKAEKIADKLKFVKLEVYNNKENADLLEQAALICKLDLNKIGVPFLYSRGKCLIGTPDVKKGFLEEVKKLKT